MHHVTCFCIKLVGSERAERERKRVTTSTTRTHHPDVDQELRHHNRHKDYKHCNAREESARDTR